MFDKFTDRARKVMQLANQEAQRFSHEYIGPEHVLLGLIKESQSIAALMISAMNVDFRKIRLEVEKLLQCGPARDTVTGTIPRTPALTRALECAAVEAKNLGHNYIGAEHLFLGLLAYRDGVASQVLASFDITLERAKATMQKMFGQEPAPSPQPPEPKFPADPNIALMKKIVRDQHRRELTSQIVGFVWLGDMLEYLSDTFSQVKAPHIPDVAGMSVKLADAVLDALEEREQSSV